MPRPLGLVTLAMFTALVSTTHGEGLVIGRWCDRAIAYTSIITIAAGDDGSMSARLEFSDGSAGDRVLDEQSGGVFAVRDSGSGDRYRLVTSTGNLQLIDNDGIIREATRLENAPAEGECR